MTKKGKYIGVLDSRQWLFEGARDLDEIIQQVQEILNELEDFKKLGIVLHMNDPPNIYFEAPSKKVADKYAFRLKFFPTNE